MTDFPYYIRSIQALAKYFSSHGVTFGFLAVFFTKIIQCQDCIICHAANQTSALADWRIPY